jgi:hypothetical protein
MHLPVLIPQTHPSILLHADSLHSSTHNISVSVLPFALSSTSQHVLYILGIFAEREEKVEEMYYLRC